MNFKLNAIVDGYFNDSSKLIFQTVQPHIEFNINRIYKLNF